MENKPAFLHNKRLLIILGTIFAFAIIINIFILIQPAEQTGTQKLLITNNLSPAPSNPIAISPTQTALPTLNIIDDNWITGENTFYTIKYLSGWKPVVNTILNGGTGATLKPAVLPPGNLLPNLHIEVTPSDASNPLSKKIEFFSPLGLKKTNITFHGIPAVRLSGTLPFKPLPENPNQSLIHKDYTFIKKSNNDFIITFAYYLDSEAAKNEQLYNAMMESFIFK